MSQELQKLIEMARKVQMSPEQIEEQRISFAYGNVRFENETVTREDVVRASKELKDHPHEAQRSGR